MVEQVLAKDPDAWQRLVQLYVPLVYGWTREMGLDSSDAQQVVHRVFKQAEKYLSEADDAEGLVLHSALWDLTVDEVSQHRDGASGTSIIQPELPAGNETQSSLMHRALRSIQVEFDESTWTMFWRVSVQNTPVEQVAEESGLKLHAVRHANYSVLYRLHKELGCDEYE